uniref:Uncharacterized protein n=1 Tax=Romanomermis culicivorax TaxID=13658 RepID=A0A915HLW3_ROMCU
MAMNLVLKKDRGSDSETILTDCNFENLGGECVSKIFDIKSCGTSLFLIRDSSIKQIFVPINESKSRYFFNISDQKSSTSLEWVGARSAT